MRAKLLPFPHSPEKVATPLPVHHQTGDEYLRVELTDDALQHVGLFAGACFIILRGAVWDGLPHALEFNGEVFLGILRFLDPHTVEFFSWHDGEHTGVHRLRRLTIIGAVCEMFPLGDSGPRWSLSTNAAKAQNHEHGTLLKVSVQ